MICISLGKIDFDNALSLCRKEELVEIRADLMSFGKKQFTDLLNAGAKIVFTCRKSGLNDSERIKLYRLAIQQNAAFVDFDMKEDENILKELMNDVSGSESKLILSYHNYKVTPGPEELKQVLRSMYSAGADIAKIACLVNKDEDNVNLLSLYRKPGNKLVLGMGEKGMITRVAAVFMGAEFTFAFPEGGNKTAPGQLTKDELEEIFAIMKS